MNIIPLRLYLSLRCLPVLVPITLAPVWLTSPPSSIHPPVYSVEPKSVNSGSDGLYFISMKFIKLPLPNSIKFFTELNL